jgi:GTP-binding protein EngB required for normal cell division
MRKKCDQEGCDAPKALCKISFSSEYQECPNFDKTLSQLPVDSKSKGANATVIPWSGIALTPDNIDILSHRSSPLLIGLIGAANAGKTSYLGMLYTLFFNGKKFNEWDFAGSYTLIAWEAQAKGLKIEANGKVAFPNPTPSNPDYYSLYHLALKKDKQLFDILFADSSGEVFTKWAAETDNSEAENAKWIYENSDAFIFFVDCEALIQGRGRAKNSISQMADQISAGLKNRPVVIVWSKADKIKDIPTRIKEAVDELIADNFHDAPVFYISNFSKSADDEMCYVNNLAATETILNKLTKPAKLNISPVVPMANDFFLDYHGKNIQ